MLLLHAEIRYGRVFKNEQVYLLYNKQWNNALRGKSHGKKIGGPKLGTLFNNIRNNLQMFYQLPMFSQKVSPTSKFFIFTNVF